MDDHVIMNFLSNVEKSSNALINYVQVKGQHMPGFLRKINFVWDSGVSVCLLPKLLITSEMLWTPFDWLNKFYNFYMAAVIGINSSHGLTITIKVCHIKQPNKSKLAMLLHFKCLKQLYTSNKIEHFSYKGDFGFIFYTQLWHPAVIC